MPVHKLHNKQVNFSLPSTSSLNKTHKHSPALLQYLKLSLYHPTLQKISLLHSTILGSAHHSAIPWYPLSCLKKHHKEFSLFFSIPHLLINLQAQPHPASFSPAAHQFQSLPPVTHLFPTSVFHPPQGPTPLISTDSSPPASPCSLPTPSGPRFGTFITPNPPPGSTEGTAESANQFFVRKLQTEPRETQQPGFTHGGISESLSF